MISVIVPTLNEANTLPYLLQRLGEIQLVSEVIVSDGGSADATGAEAQKWGARIVEHACGRGPQLNAGAAIATAPLLWFLHADALPHPGCARQMAQAWKSGAVGGNFRLRFAWQHPAARSFEMIARIQRSRGIYYGDSGIWVTHQAWEQIGAFSAWPLFEDYEFACRLEQFARQKGRRTVCCAGPLWASPRRFQQHPWATLWLWMRLQFWFHSGVHPAELANRYRR